MHSTQADANALGSASPWVTRDHLQARRKGSEPWASVEHILVSTVLVINQQSSIRNLLESVGFTIVEVKFGEPVA